MLLVSQQAAVPLTHSLSLSPAGARSTKYYDLLMILNLDVPLLCTHLAPCQPVSTPAQVPKPLRLRLRFGLRRSRERSQTAPLSAPAAWLPVPLYRPLLHPADLPL